MEKLKKSKAAILKKAEEYSIKYEKLYKGCAQCTFLSIADSLRWGGFEIIPEAMEETLFPGISLLTAGGCMTGEGTCGALASSIIALGLASGISKDSSDVTAVRQSAAAAKNKILDVYFNKYRSILCKDIQRKYFGKAWDLADDKMAREFLGITKGCIISEAAVLAVESILDAYELKIENKS